MKDVNLIVRDLSKLYGTSTPLVATVLDDGTALVNRTLIFTVNGVSYNRVTGSDGKASLNINLIPGTYPCSVHFVGGDGYNQTTRNCIVRVINNTTPQKETKKPGNYFEVNKIPLHVTMSGGFDVTPGQNIKETTLLHDSNNFNTPTFYFNAGFDGDEFEVSIVVKESDFYNGEQVMSILNSWNKTNLAVSVVTDSMIVANGKYTMQIKSKSQNLERRSIWKLRFKQYYEDNLSFESMYDRKTSTLSSIDQLLLKQLNGITEKSSREVITALQRKMRSVGYWTEPIDGYSAGSWNGIPTMIRNFQYDIMGVIDRKVGLYGVDYETITALIDYSYGGNFD